MTGLRSNGRPDFVPDAQLILGKFWRLGRYKFKLSDWIAPHLEAAEAYQLALR
jgi:hypothetical protein